KLIPSDVVNYWERVRSAIPTAIPKSERKGIGPNIKTVKMVMSLEDTRSFATNANQAYGTQSVELLVTALTRALKPYAVNNQVVIEMEGHGREGINDSLQIERTVGWFTSLYPLELTSGIPELPEHIKVIKEEIRSVPNKGIDYGIL